MDPFTRLRIAYSFFKTKGFVPFYALKARYALLKSARKFGEKE